jgi:hypothetical protein
MVRQNYKIRIKIMSEITKTQYIVIIDSKWAELYPGRLYSGEDDDIDPLNQSGLDEYLCNNVINDGSYTIVELDKYPNITYYVPNRFVHGVVKFSGNKPKLGFIQ